MRRDIKNLKEMFIDSVKYSINGRKEFLFLGILLWSLGFISSLVTNSPFFLILIIPWLIAGFIQIGYLANIIDLRYGDLILIQNLKISKNLLGKE